VELRIPAHPLERDAGGPAELDAVLRRASGPGPHPAVVLLHGCAGLRDGRGAIRARDAEWSRLLVAQGFTTLHVDSFAPRGVSAVCGERNPEGRLRISAERARDAYAALLHLQSRPDIRGDAVALMGWSNGGGTTLWALARGSRARPAGLAKDFVAGVAFYTGCGALSRLQQPWRPVAPVLLLVGEADDWTPAAPCVALAARAGEAVELHVYPGAHHDFDAPDQPLVRRRGVGSTASGMATIGTDPAARTDALGRVPLFLSRAVGSR
jgi:dienelactone hydrolase